MTQETTKDLRKVNVPRTQRDGRHEDGELWDHSSKIPFGIHHSQGSNRDKHEVGAFSVHEEEERKNKHNQKPKERSSQEVDHRGARRVICCVWLVKEYN